MTCWRVFFCRRSLVGIPVEQADRLPFKNGSRQIYRYSRDGRYHTEGRRSESTGLIAYGSVVRPLFTRVQGKRNHKIGEREQISGHSFIALLGEKNKSAVIWSALELHRKIYGGAFPTDLLYILCESGCKYAVFFYGVLFLCVDGFGFP